MAQEIRNVDELLLSLRSDATRVALHGKFRAGLDGAAITVRISGAEVVIPIEDPSLVERLVHKAPVINGGRVFFDCAAEIIADVSIGLDNVMSISSVVSGRLIMGGDQFEF